MMVMKMKMMLKLLMPMVCPSDVRKHCSCLQPLTTSLDWAGLGAGSTRFCASRSSHCYSFMHLLIVHHHHHHHHHHRIISLLLHVLFILLTLPFTFMCMRWRHASYQACSIFPLSPPYLFCAGFCADRPTGSFSPSVNDSRPQPCSLHLTTNRPRVLVSISSSCVHFFRCPH